MKYPKLITLVCFLLAFLLAIVLVWPQYQDYLRVVQKLENKKNFLENQTKYFQEIYQAANRLEEQAQNVRKINAILPDDVGYSSLVSYLDKVSGENGLIAQKISVRRQGSLKDKENIKENHFFISLVGTYSAFRNFLAELEKSSRLFEIEEISFSTPKLEGDFFNFDISFKIYSY